MATTYTTKKHDEGSATAKNMVGVNYVYDRFTQSAAFVINDVVRSVYVPKNAVILDAWVGCEDLDTHATPTITLTLRLNNGTTQHNFNAAETIGQTGGLARADLYAPMGLEITTALWYLELLVAAAPATGTTDKEIRFGLAYTMDRINADL